MRRRTMRSASLAICLADDGAVMMAIVAPFLGRANRATIAAPDEALAIVMP